MTTDVYRIRIEIPHDGGLPENSVMNTWHYEGDPDNLDRDGDLDVIESELDAFYTSFSQDWGNSQYDWANIKMTAYDLSEPRPRVPFDTRTFAVPQPTAAGYDFPVEVACVLTLAGSPSSGQLNRRRRGRVFIGPFQTLYTGDNHLVPAGLITALSSGASALLHPTAGSVSLVVVSEFNKYDVPYGETITHGPKDPVTGNRPLITPPREENLALDATWWTDVVTIHIDNAWDTQRRRGTAATTRTSITD